MEDIVGHLLYQILKYGDKALRVLGVGFLGLGDDLHKVSILAVAQDAIVALQQFPAQQVGELVVDDAPVALIDECVCQCEYLLEVLVVVRAQALQKYHHLLADVIVLLVGKG